VDIKPWDWKRILLGEAPPEFMVEVFIRTLIMYFLLLIIIRLMGKRMSGQISITEFSVMITLGAIVSPAMQLPDRAILFGLTALVVVYLLHTLINTLSTRSEKADLLTEGRLTCLVKDGLLQLDAMKKTGISRQELFSQLRKKNIELLSEVDRVYFEACGQFSIFRSKKQKPGLIIFPEKDKDMMQYKHATNHGLHACFNCGHVQNSEKNTRCEMCGQEEWITAFV
jgi:uncharacterized membrane protein YcaP (DUF421 family)